ncbi:MAG: hypothetical protein SGPRY_008573 [Prymnesium sp.]
MQGDQSEPSRHLPAEALEESSSGVPHASAQEERSLSEGWWRVSGQPDVMCQAIPTNLIGRIIGKEGGTIKRIRQQSRAEISVEPDDGAGIQAVYIRGSSSQLAAAIRLIDLILTTDGRKDQREMRQIISIATSKVGRIIGPKGSHVQALRSYTGARVTVRDPSEDDTCPVVIEGEATAVGEAIRLIREEVDYYESPSDPALVSLTPLSRCILAITTEREDEALRQILDRIFLSCSAYHEEDDTCEWYENGMEWLMMKDLKQWCREHRVRINLDAAEEARIVVRSGVFPCEWVGYVPQERKKPEQDSAGQTDEPSANLMGEPQPRAWTPAQFDAGGSAPPSSDAQSGIGGSQPQHGGLPAGGGVAQMLGRSAYPSMPLGEQLSPELLWGLSGEESERLAAAETDALLAESSTPHAAWSSTDWGARSCSTVGCVDWGRTIGEVKPAEGMPVAVPLPPQISLAQPGRCASSSAVPARAADADALDSAKDGHAPSEAVASAEDAALRHLRETMDVIRRMQEERQVLMSRALAAEARVDERASHVAAMELELVQAKARAEDAERKVAEFSGERAAIERLSSAQINALAERMTGALTTLNDEKRRRNDCVVCMERQRNIVFIPFLDVPNLPQTNH